MSEFKEITLGDFINAMKRNGYEQAFGNWIDYRFDEETQKTKVVACAMGQGLLNLGLDRGSFIDAMVDAHLYGEFLSPIYKMNDDQKLSVMEIVKWAKEKFADKLNTKLVVKKKVYNT